MMGAVLGGAALSLLLGASPAHAAEDPGGGQGPLAPAVSDVSTAARAASTTAGMAIDHAMPVTQRALHGADRSLIGAAPATARLVAPVLSGVGATLAAVDRAIVPTVDPLLRSLRTATAVAGNALMASTESMSVDSHPAPAARSALTTVAGGPNEETPDPLLTSGGSAGAGALGVLLLTVLALATPGGRVRGRDDGLPASPFFETDTSPA
jgi:hypothetical protein